VSLKALWQKKPFKVTRLDLPSPSHLFPSISTPSTDTGDVLHFGLAKEQFYAQNPKSQIRLLAVGDDISVGRQQGKMVGRRGLAVSFVSFSSAFISLSFVSSLN